MLAPNLRRASVATATMTLAGLGFLTTAPVHAASAELDFTCTLFGFPELPEGTELGAEERRMLDAAREGEASLDALADEIPEVIEIPGLKLSASFDSAIADGATTTAPSTVQLEPVKGAIVLSAEAVAEIRKLGLTEGVAGALLLAGIEETGADSETDFFFDAVSLPESGSLTLSTDDGYAEPFRANAAGTFTYVAGDMELFIASEDEESVMFAGFSCVPDEGQDLTIDQIVATGAPTTTPTPTPSAPGPVRPDVVQTDAAQPTSPTWLPLTAAGIGSVLLFGAASQLVGRAGRRH
ncbi:hypothetical protein LL946_15215 [Knoellia locipacati]|uniref:hypothetical protein n=1 Tax=Knoellia locipacati TaxID=882824 RepID=UPI00384B1848